MKHPKNMKSYSIDWYVDKFNKGETFSVARYGDGELMCMEGRQGGNSQGCQYTPELRQDLLKSLEPKAGLIHLVSSTMLIEDQKTFEKYKNGEWGDTEVFPEALKSGELKKYFDAIRKYKIVIISSKEKRALPIPYDHFIETPYCNTYFEKQRIINEVLAYGEPAVYLFSCGISAGVITNELHGKIKGAWFIDFGHIVDAFIGVMSRGYLEELTHEQIFKNI